MTLGLTQPLTEMSTGSISWGKDGRCVRLTNYHHHVPLSRNLGTVTFWNSLGPSGPVTGLLLPKSNNTKQNGTKYMYLLSYNFWDIVS